MTKLLSCGDVVDGCAAEFEAATEAELLAKVAEHAKNAHGLTDIDAKTQQAVRAAIRTETT